MCGIVGYIGHRQAWPIVLKGLKRLEYRGYDSAGIAVFDKNIETYKKAGKVAALENLVNGEAPGGCMAIGHTRWATHGEPNDVNAHPHNSYSGRLTLVHNGIIENYSALKLELEHIGHHMQSDTDTEVLAHFIEHIMEQEQADLLEGVRLALGQVVGAYAIAVMDRDQPNQLVVARKGSPLVIGIGENEHFIASDASPIVEFTRSVTYLGDEEIALLTADEIVVKTIQNKGKTPFIQFLEMRLDQLEKAGYDYYMLKEIHEQARSVRDCLRGRIDTVGGKVQLGGLKAHEDQLKNTSRIIMIGCGTSWHAALVGAYLIEEYARVPVSVEYASEFRYRNPIIFKDDIVIAISQSGETADTLAALELAKSRGATILGICNVVGSSIPRMTDAGVYTHAGPEIGVASTKAFTAQVTVLTLLSLYMAQLKGQIQDERLNELLAALDNIPHQIEEVLASDSAALYIAQEIQHRDHALFLGRGLGFPVALEGALKLKEISYIHAEGYPAAEMKHGPIALIDENMPVIVIATQHSSYEKVISNIQEVKARKGRIIAIVTQGDERVKKLADFTIEIPVAEEIFLPLLATIPLQFLAYHTALLRGCNVDQPRNLAKSVTVE